MADTTTAGPRPSRARARRTISIRRAMASGSATDVPPNFCTTNLIFISPVLDCGFGLGTPDFGLQAVSAGTRWRVGGTGRSPEPEQSRRREHVADRYGELIGIAGLQQVGGAARVGGVRRQ